MALKCPVRWKRHFQPRSFGGGSIQSRVPVVSILELSDTKIYEPQKIRARLETAAHFCQEVVLKLRSYGGGSIQSRVLAFSNTPRLDQIRSHVPVFENTMTPTPGFRFGT